MFPHDWDHRGLGVVSLSFHFYRLLLRTHTFRRNFFVLKESSFPLVNSILHGWPPSWPVINFVPLLLFSLYSNTKEDSLHGLLVEQPVSDGNYGLLWLWVSLFTENGFVLWLSVDLTLIFSSKEWMWIRRSNISLV